MNQDILIAYFSRSGNNYVNGSIVDLPVGNTEVIAGKIGRITDGVLFKIDPAVPYPADYTACTETAQRELQADARPELTGWLDSLDRFHTIILCYPNYWGTMPMPVWTFLERYDCSGKVILPLCTHEGSGMGRSEDDIKRLAPDAAMRKGLAIQGAGAGSADRELAGWLQSNQIKIMGDE